MIIKPFCRTVAILLGILQAWANHFYLSIDGITYLDIADAYLRRDWDTAINGGYSPLYSWLLALATFLFKPSDFWESTCICLVNILIYLFALLCFEFFLSKLINRFTSFSDWALLLLSYILFILCSLYMIGVNSQTPDLLVSAFVYLISGILLHIKAGHGNWFTFFLFGLILGLSYLTKEFMLPLGFGFLAIGTILVSGYKKRILYTLIALLVFAIVASPFIYALSKNKGYLTFGEAWKLNYAWDVNDLPESWVIGSTEIKPTHPVKKIFDNPPIYEFGNHFEKTTYPFVYDPSYWFYGIPVHFDLKKQLRILLMHIRRNYEYFLYSQIELIFGLLMLFYVSGRKWLCLKDIREQWVLLFPALTTIFIYSLVHLEPRYIGGFVLLLWIALFMAVRLPDLKEYKKLASCTIIAISIITMTRILPLSTQNFYHIIQDLKKGKEANVSWQIASELGKMGLSARDKIATIWGSNGAHWARLAKVNIAYELWESPEMFWGGDLKQKSKVVDAFAMTSAKAIITENIPDYAIEYARAYGWQMIGDTEHYVYFIRREI